MKIWLEDTRSTGMNRDVDQESVNQAMQNREISRRYDMTHL